MTDEVAGLKIYVDSTTADDAGDSLDRLEDASKRAESATDALGASAKKAAQAIGEEAGAADDAAGATKRLAETQEEQNARLKEMVRRSLEARDAQYKAAESYQNSSKAVTRLSESAAKANSALKGISGDSLAQSFQEMANEATALQSAMENQSASLDDVAEKRLFLAEAVGKGLVTEKEYQAHLKTLVRDETRIKTEIAGHAREVQNLLRQYDPASAALRRLAQDQRTLEQGLRSGTISQEQYNRALAQITVNRTRWQAEAKGVQELSQKINVMGLASNAAFRDYATLLSALGRGDVGLAGNQFLQLGARIGALRVLLTPLAIGIGGVATALLGYVAAAYKGEKQSAALALAIETTGNAAGVTAGQIEQIAESASDISGITLSAARRAATAMVQAGTLGGRVIENLTGSLQTFAAVTGQSTDQAAKALVDLFEKPGDGAEKLFKQFGFLTAADVKYIQTLEQQGRVEEAQLSLSTSLYEFLGGKATESLGTLETLWKGVKDAISGAGDALMAIGRTNTVEEQIKDTEELIKRLEHVARIRAGSAAGSSIFVQRLKEAREELQRLQDLQVQGEKEAKENAADRLAEQKLLAANKEFDPRALEQQRELARLEGELASVRSGALKNDQSRAQAVEEYLKFSKEAAKLTDDQRASLRANAAAADALASAIARATKANEDRRGATAAFESLRVELAQAIVSSEREIGNLQNNQLASEERRTITLEKWLEFNAAAKRLLPSEIELLRQMARQADEAAKRVDVAKLRRSADEGLAQVNAEFLASTGRNAEAAVIEIRRKFAQLRADLKTLGDTDGILQIDKLIDVKSAEAQLRDLAAETERIFSSLERRQQSIGIATTTRVISEVEGRKQIAALNAQTIDQIDALIPKMRALVDITKDPAAAAALEDLLLKVQELKVQTNTFGSVFGQAFESSFASALQRLTDGTTSLRDAANAFLRDITSALSRFASEGLANSLTSGIQNLFAGAGNPAQAAQLQASAATLTTAGASVTAGGAAVSTGAAALTGASGAMTAGAAAVSAAAIQLQAAAASMAAASAASIGAGFAGGGYTGDGPAHAPAGIVHKGEHVTRAAVVRQPGALTFLSDLNRRGMQALADRLRGYAQGGLVTAPAAPAQLAPVRSVADTGAPVMGKLAAVIGVDEGATMRILESRGFDDLLIRKMSRNGSRVRAALNI